jgi:hypothetical protein
MGEAMTTESRAAQIEAIGKTAEFICSHTSWEAEQLLDAVYPLIEAEVREQVARELANGLMVGRRMGEPPESFDFRVAIINQACAIARGMSSE